MSNRFKQSSFAVRFSGSELLRKKVSSGISVFTQGCFCGHYVGPPPSQPTGFAHRIWLMGLQLQKSFMM